MVSYTRGAQRVSNDVRPRLVARQGKEEVHDAKRQEVGNQRNYEEELGKVFRRPGSLKIAASVEKGEAADGDSKYVAFDKRRRNKRPWVDDGHLRNQCQVWYYDIARLSPLAITDSSAQQRLQCQGDKGDARDGGDVDSGGHLVG